MKTVFLRVLASVDKAEGLRQAVRAVPAGFRVDRDAALFEAVPGSPFNYWTGDSLHSSFARLKPFASEGRITKQGGICGDDFRWIRRWFESDPSDRRYVPFLKGGGFSAFYSQLPIV